MRLWKDEVIVELWCEGKPKFCLLDGGTGRVRREVESPLDMSVRQPKGYQCTRPVPMALVAHLHGRNAPPSLVPTYEASNRIPCHAFALDAQLKTLWHVSTRPTGMGHISTVADLVRASCGNQPGTAAGSVPVGKSPGVGRIAKACYSKASRHHETRLQQTKERKP